MSLSFFLLTITLTLKKQPFADVLQNRCSLKINTNIHRKTHVLESLFNKTASLKACNFTKKETPT